MLIGRTRDSQQIRWADGQMGGDCSSPQSGELRQAASELNYFIGTSILKMADTDYHKNA